MNLQETITWAPVRIKPPRNDFYLVSFRKKAAKSSRAWYFDGKFFGDVNRLYPTHYAEMPKGPK